MTHELCLGLYSARFVTLKSEIMKIQCVIHDIANCLVFHETDLHSLYMICDNLLSFGRKTLEINSLLPFSGKIFFLFEDFSRDTSLLMSYVKVPSGVSFYT